MRCHTKALVVARPTVLVRDENTKIRPRNLCERKLEYSFGTMFRPVSLLGLLTKSSQIS